MKILVTMDQSVKQNFRRSILTKQGKYGFLNLVHTTR